MIGKPLYENPLAGGQPNMSRVPNISLRRPNNPSSSLKPGFGLPTTLEAADPNNLMPGFSPPTGGTLNGIPTFTSDTRDRTLQDPYEFGGAGMLGLARADGTNSGPIFMKDENRPRSEEDIRNRYEQAKEKAAESRRNGFLGQVVLPGEGSYDQFKDMNSFFLKRNPNIPESAYSNYDLTDVGGFGGTPSEDTGMKGLPETNQPPMFAIDGGPTVPEGSSKPMNPFQPGFDSQEPPGNLIGDTSFTPQPTDPFGLGSFEKSVNPISSGNDYEIASSETQPYNRVGQQLSGFDEDGNVLERLTNIEKGIASLEQGGMNQSSFGGFNNNFGIGSFFPPYGGMYGQ